MVYADYVVHYMPAFVEVENGGQTVRIWPGTE